MCLAIPGKIISISTDHQNTKLGEVSFSGVTKKVCLDFVPDAKINDYVIVHVGFALSILNEEEARNSLKFFEANENVNPVSENSE
jgi:hydrogenase expression/formation protein HypC